MIDRHRLTERVSPSLLRLELKRATRPLVTIAIGVIAAMAAGAYILNELSGGAGGTHTMQFEVANATAVVPGRDQTRFLGIQAGTITNARLVHGGAVLTVTVANKFGPIYRNAQAELRPNTPLEDMYLDITSRGSKNAGLAGPKDIVPESLTQSPTNLADVLNLFQPDVRAQLNTMLNQFGNGLAGRGGDLRAAFVQLAPFLNIAGNVAGQLAERASLTKHLVSETSVLASVLASRTTQLHQLVTSGARTLESLAAEGGQPLQQTIDETPATLSAMQTFLADLNPVLTPLNGAVNSLEPVAAELPAGLRNLKALAQSATPAVDKLQTPVRKLVPLADQLQPFSADLAAALTQIKPQVSAVNALTTDLADCTTQLNEFLNWDASMSSIRDVNLGQLLRGNAHVGFFSDVSANQPNYGSGSQCDGGEPIGAVPTPKYPGPPPAP